VAKIDLCPLLKITNPKYHLEASQGRNDVFSGYATFPQETSLPVHVENGRIGQASMIFGRSNAKENLAQAVYNYLAQVALQRGIVVQEE
jgi:hypothetical protein